MVKRDWTCPNCQGALQKKENDGEGIKRCQQCKASWLLILCRSPIDLTFGQLELFEDIKLDKD